ncbi:MAG: hypothetical protein M3Q99_19590 [Acidobacteriota bacterium]|nr:hypothetical protein [Acidobacteriota bacterium]
MKHISKITLGLSLAAVFGISLCCVSILLRGQSGFAQSRVNSDFKMDNQKSVSPTGRIAPAGEAINNSHLKTLLAADNLQFDETAMLSPQVEKSQTFFIRLKNQQSASNDSLSNTPSGKSELFLQQIKNSSQGVARQRSLELSTTQILIVALNEKQQVLWWHLQTDPRILRLETADDAGRLSNPDVIYRDETDLLVSLPDDETITETRFYHPNWDGREFSLELIGSLNIAK